MGWAGDLLGQGVGLITGSGIVGDLAGAGFNFLGDKASELAAWHREQDEKYRQAKAVGEAKNADLAQYDDAIKQAKSPVQAAALKAKKAKLYQDYLDAG